MINQKVLNALAWMYSIFDIKLLTLIAAGFTIYFGYQKISRRISVSYSVNHSVLYDAHITNLVVSNKRDNTVVVSSINLEIGNKGGFKLIKFDEPLVLKGYESCLVDVPMYSGIYDENGLVAIEFNDRLRFTIITMSGNMIECLVESPLNPSDFDGQLYKHTSTFNNIVLTNKMSHIFSYFENGQKERVDVIFDKHGFIPENSPFKYNKFQSLSVDSFRDFLVHEGYHDYFTNYALFKVDDELSTELILNKSMVNSYLTGAGK